LPSSDALRQTPGYRRCREAGVDSIIRQQLRIGHLEAGLAVIVETQPDSWHRRQLVEIVDGIKAGKSATQIAVDMGVGRATIDRRLAEVRNARVNAEAEELAQ
jgi:DNA-binding phage protein